MTTLTLADTKLTKLSRTDLGCAGYELRCGAMRWTLLESLFGHRGWRATRRSGWTTTLPDGRFMRFATLKDARLRILGEASR